MVVPIDETEISVDHQELTTTETLLRAPCDSPRTGIFSIDRRNSGTNNCKPPRVMESIRRRFNQFSNAARNFYENAEGASAAFLLNPQSAIRNVVSALRPPNKPYKTTVKPSI